MPSTIGVRQGSCEGPALFLFIVQAALETMDWPVDKPQFSTKENGETTGMRYNLKKGENGKSKTEAMYVPAPRMSEPSGDESNFKVAHGFITFTSCFKYLGSLIHKSLKSDADIKTLKFVRVRVGTQKIADATNAGMIVCINFSYLFFGYR